jgi:putative redox protein
MANTTVKWIGGEQFVGIDSTKHSVVLSTTAAGVGMKPSEMLLVALAACTAVDVVQIMEKKRQPLQSFQVNVSGEQDADPPWTFRKIHLKYIISGKELTQTAIEQAIHLSEEKYCSVAATIRGVAEITTEYEVVPLDN